MQWDVLGILLVQGCAAQGEGMKVHLWLYPAPPCPDATLEMRATEYLGLCTGNTCPVGKKMLEYPREDVGLCKRNMGHSWVLVTRKQKVLLLGTSLTWASPCAHRLAARWW